MSTKSIINPYRNKQGHIYIASNVGSFGFDVFKIGVTRRLNPRDRVKELNTCCVPFPFELHATIYSDDVFMLERKIHIVLRGNALNKINKRKEFFRVSIHELAKKLKSLGITLEYYNGCEASEFIGSKRHTQ